MIVTSAVYSAYVNLTIPILTNTYGGMVPYSGKVRAFNSKGAVTPTCTHAGVSVSCHAASYSTTNSEEFYSITFPTVTTATSLAAPGPLVITLAGVVNPIST